MADYPISNVPRRVQYVNSGVGPYAFTFEVLVQTDIAVYRGSTLLTLTADYTVTINANGTGSVTLVTAGTGNITIVGARAVQRSSDYTTGGDLFASTLNTDLDSQTIFSQQLAEDVARSVKAPVYDSAILDMSLPDQASRANKLLGFNASGRPMSSATTVTQLDAAVSSFINNTGNNSSSIIYDPAGISAVSTTVESKLRETISVKDFGAVADYNESTGVGTDNSAAFQAAINFASSAIKAEVFIPPGSYLLNTSLNITNKFSGFTLCGEAGFKVSGSDTGTRLYGNTGDVPLIDFIGTQHGIIRNLSIISANAAATPSTVGVYFARSTTSQFAQFCSVDNCSIHLQTNPTVNNGRGSVALYNVAAEIFVVRDSYLLADSGCVFTSQNVWNVVSAYRTQGGPSSCSTFFIEGNCTFHSLDAVGAPFWANATQVIKGQFYVNGANGVGSHGFRLTGINTGHDIGVFVEGAQRLGRIDNGLNSSRITTFSGTDSTRYIDTDGDFVGVSDCQFFFKNSGGGGSGGPDYLISGNNTDRYTNVHITSFIVPVIRALVPTNETTNLINCSWEYDETSQLTKQTLKTRTSTWSDFPLRIGAFYLWVDSTGVLRIKSGAPTSDTDGTVVGTQT